MWFKMDLHFAAFSGPDFEDVVVQCMWFLIAGNHLCNTEHSFFFAIVFNFLDRAENTEFYNIFKHMDNFESMFVCFFKQNSFHTNVSRNYLSRGAKHHSTG